ncbi:hypothetical protein BBP40_003138 [Aspergillus hancockii]|nr:hypothetical protein BBP40_003138 [Aspergillus hancockii]
MVNIPLEILLLMFEDLSCDLLEQKRIWDFGNLVLASKGSKNFVEPFLYREIHTDGDYINSGGDDQKARDTKSLSPYYSVSSTGSVEPEEPAFRPDIDVANVLTESKLGTVEAKNWLLKFKNVEEATSRLGISVHFCGLSCLEELSFIVDVGNRSSWDEDAVEEPENILESILSRAGNIKRLVLEDY